MFSKLLSRPGLTLSLRNSPMCRPVRSFASRALLLVAVLAAEFLLVDTAAQAAVNTPAKTTPHRSKKAEDFGIPQVALINAQIRHG